MILKDNTPDVSFNWLFRCLSSEKRVALLIPQYNEGKNTNLDKRLQYFTTLASQYSHFMDVILIDDGSTDDSLKRILEFYEDFSPSFSVVSVWPNQQKVGALDLTVQNIKHEYVILSDFDTDLLHLHNLDGAIMEMDQDDSSMGCFFKMSPFEGNGLVFKFQQMEYSFARMYYKLHRNEKSVPVMPGAGCCYKRTSLLAVYEDHSGFRNGEDREATIIGLKMGFTTMYYSNIHVLTRPPLTFGTLLIQRKRWYLGYMETVVKERQFFLRSLGRLDKVALRVLQDGIGIICLLLSPILFLLIITTLGFFGTTILVGSSYIVSLLYYSFLFFINQDEQPDLHLRDLLLLLFYPIFWLSLSFLAWFQVFMSFKPLPEKCNKNNTKILALPNRKNEVLTTTFQKQKDLNP